MGRFPLLAAAACLGLLLGPGAAAAGGAAEAEDLKKKHHHHHHHHHKGHHHRGHHSAAQAHQQLKEPEAPEAAKAANTTSKTAPKSKASPHGGNTTGTPKAVPDEGMLQVNAPLPANFAELFARGVAAAVGCDAKEVRVLGTKEAPGEKGKLEEVRFSAKKSVVEAVLDQAADAESKLASGPLCPFLVAKVDEGDVSEQCQQEKPEAEGKEGKAPEEPAAAELAEDDAEEAPPRKPRRRPRRDEAEAAEVAAGGAVDVDVEDAMPFGDLEPFGREDTAQELTESAIKESNAMVDQLERAEVAEEKRAVFRALTRLRGAAITSFDGIARSQTSTIDEYNKLNQWRKAHPLNHLANQESDISKWAFPDASL